MAVDWVLMKGQFVAMHMSKSDLAKFHNVSIAMVDLAEKDGEWTRMESDTNDTDSMSERTLAYTSGHKSLSTLMFASIEIDMFEALKTRIANVAEGPAGSAELKMLSEILERHRPEAFKIAKEGGSDNQLNIRIMAQAGGTDSPSVSAVEITGSAGKSNGVGTVQVN